MINKLNLFGENLPKEKHSLEYTTKVSVPQYTPKGEMPAIHALTNIKKYEQLVNDINQANITAEEKDFLLKAATRHIVFRYDKIAEYYCHASKEMQELMEDSALVIIDFEDAIAKGYVKLDAKLTELAKNAYHRREAKKAEE